MGKNDGKGDSIYGGIPDGGADAVVSEAMGSLDDFFSNKINGPVKTKDTQYPEKD